MIPPVSSGSWWGRAERYELIRRADTPGTAQHPSIGSDIDETIEPRFEPEAGLPEHGRIDGICGQLCLVNLRIGIRDEEGCLRCGEKKRLVTS